MTKLVKLDHFIARGGMAWGRATGVRTALNNWFGEERPTTERKVEIWQVNEEAHVDGMGTLYSVKGAKKLGTVTITRALIKKLDEIEGDFEELLLDVQAEVDLDAEYTGIQVEEKAA